MFDGRCMTGSVGMVIWQRISIYQYMNSNNADMIIGWILVILVMMYSISCSWKVAGKVAGKLHT